MAFDQRTFSTAAYTLGDVLIRAWDYFTSDPYATVAASGYFTDDKIQVGDIIRVQNATDATTYVLEVSSVDPVVTSGASFNAVVKADGQTTGRPLSAWLGDEVWIQGFGVDLTGTVDATERYMDWMEYVATNHKVGRIPGGAILRFDSAPLVFTGYEGFQILADNNVEFRDYGRTLPVYNAASAPSATMLIPWGHNFYDGGDIWWTGVTYRTMGTLSGSSAGAWGPTNYTERRPCFGFWDCGGQVRVRRFGRQGEPGKGISGTAKALIAAAEGFTTPEQYIRLNASGAFFTAAGCPDFRRDDCFAVPDSGANREMMYLTECSGEMAGEVSVSTGQNMASFAKLLNNHNFTFGRGFQIADTSTASFVDVTGTNVIFDGTGGRFDLPASAKIVDYSHEGNQTNVPVTDCQLRNVVTSAIGPVSVGSDNVGANPITGLKIANCKFNEGAVAWSSDRSPQTRSVIDVTWDGIHLLNTTFCGYSEIEIGMQSIVANDSSMTYTVPSGSLDSNNRSIQSRVLTQFNNFTLQANASNGGLASLPVNGRQAGAQFVYSGGRIVDTTLALTGTLAAKFIGVDLSDFAYTLTDEDTTAEFAGCSLDGLVMPDMSPETTAVQYQFTTPALYSDTLSLEALIRWFKDIGAWDAITCCVIAVQYAEDQVYVDLKNPWTRTIAESGSLVFLSETSIAGNGSSSYLNTNVNPSTDALMTQNSAYVGVWGGGDGSQRANWLIGGVSSGTSIRLNPRNTSDQFTAAVNDSGPFTVANTDSRGYFSAWRTEASVRNWGINGVTGAGDTQAVGTPTSTTLTLGSRGTNYNDQPWLGFIAGSGSLATLDNAIYQGLRRMFRSRGAI